ncbi:hypothetical protein G4B88_004623, partial [Cannabis sativa]
MEFVISIGAKIAEYTVAPVGRQLGYLLCYTRNVEKLKTQAQDLKDAKDRLQHRVEEARNNCQEIEADVKRWLSSFDQISEKVDTFLNHEDHAKAACSCGSLPHLVTRHQLSRKAKKLLIEEVFVLTGKCNFDTISYPPHLHSSSTAIATTTTAAAITKGYESFDSRRVILENIMAAVRDANRSRIGLHGMGGLGKTMLAKEIARQAKEEKLFSTVVITTISQTPNIKEIQQHIAEKLDVTIFSQIESISKRAEVLQQRLKPENRILLILDDIWRELNLEEIGIHDGCKILVTSRYAHVLHNMGMAESDVFLIKALESSEAISLFKKIIGDTKVENNAYYNALAVKIVDECGGLPISISTVAHALKFNMDSLFMWEDALQRLQSSNFTGIGEMRDKVYLSIRLSYDFLGRHEEEAKSLLLLCALHAEDEEIKVEELMRYSIGWNLLQGVRTVSEARNRVNSLVVKLKSHSLLLDGTHKNDEVKMHDVIRDVCIVIAKGDDDHDDHKNIKRMNNITSVASYEEFVIHERHKSSKAISFLDYDDFDNLPQTLECPQLELLLLSTGSNLELIPDEFFEQTRQLKALISNNTYLESLPPSFHLLQNLQTLCLRDSCLKDIAMIGELKNLKVLDVSWSESIERLPKEIGALQRLQVLDLRGCRNLRVIEPNIISNLTQMEELYMPHKFQGWDKIEEGGIRNASLIEIKSLQRLTVLYLSVSSEHVFREELFTEKLERYLISIGGGFSSDFYTNKFSRLIDVANIVVGDLSAEGFPSLQSLRLSQMTSLERIICHGCNELPRGFFNELRRVDVWSCGRLKYLFPLCVAKLIHHITIRKCEMMEEIIVSHNIHIDHHSSSLQLRSLELYNLPNLVQFYDCFKLKPTTHSSPALFSETVHFFLLFLSFSFNLPNYIVYLCESTTSVIFAAFLFYVGEVDCVEIKHKKVMARPNYVEDCKAIEDIIRVVKLGEEESIDDDHDRILERIDLFPKLESVTLVRLSGLQRFCSATIPSSCMVFPLLSELIIEDCPKLRTYISSATSNSMPTHVPVDHVLSTQTLFNEKVCFSNYMEHLIVEGVNTKELWPEKTLSSYSYMHNLTSLEVDESCNSLRYMFSFSVAQMFVNLRTLKVSECKAMEDIVVKLGEEETQLQRGFFPKLESLELNGLSALQRFCATDSCMVFPLVSDLIIRGCPELKTFVSSPTIVPIRQVCIDHKEEKQLNPSTQHFLAAEKSTGALSFLGNHEEEAKPLLLLCALHKEDEEIQVEKLMRYSMGWHLLQGIYRVSEIAMSLRVCLLKNWRDTKCIEDENSKKGRVEASSRQDVVPTTLLTGSNIYGMGVGKERKKGIVCLLTMEFVISIGAKIAEYTVAPLGRQLGYLFRYTTNVSELRTQLEDLNNATQRMERRVNEALNNCHEIEADVQTWQKNAEQISGEATTFLNPQTHAKALCSCGSPHHLVTRHQLSRKANKMSVNVRAVVLKNKEFDSMPISYPRPPEGSSATPAKGYESFDSRGEILKSILAAVGDGNKRIGLHGMGGIGKTMLAKEITRLAQEDKLFSKVVVTTVSQTPNIKEIQQHIAEKLGLKLEEKDKSSEAINLFIKIIGDTKTDYINALALEIVNECGGLPIAIATVAHALKYKKEEAIWKDALRRLKSSDVNDKVYSSIKLSYDFLGSHEEEAKSLLLLCALHKEDEEIQVEDLMRYSMGWRLLQGIYAVSEARNRVNSLVDTLKSHCLLLDGTSTSDEVKMHDVIRDVCIKIAKEDHGHGHMMMNNITSAAMYEEFVFHERHKASKAISFLDYGDFDNLPQKLDCPMLELLLLSSGSYLESIPNDFFEQTRQLKVLCMKRTWIGSLPSSFASLQNLQTLRLRDFSLEDIAVIGELKNLKALDLSYCHSIERLPKEIGALTLLQVLDLRECYKLRVIEANVISNLTQIEELYLPNEFEGWDEIINEEGGVRNGSLIEIKSLQRLTALHLYVPRQHVLPQMLRLQLYQLDQIYGSGSGLDLVMKGSEYLSLDGLNCVNNVFHDLHKDGFPRLKELSFGNNDGFHYIINSTHHQAFPSLESLRLSGLRSLESIICHGGNNKLPIGSFNQLREVYVRCCGRLKNLFPLSVAKLLHQITVQECEMIEEIIVREDGDEVGHNIDGDDDHSSSLQLRSLHLEYLPKLVQFYCSNHRAVCFPNLEDLTIKKMDIEMLWPEQLMLSSTSSFYMQNLTSLKVGSCHNLKYLFFSSVAQKFVNLKKIKVEDCEGMEDIIRVVPGEEESTHHHHDQIERIDLLPKLQSVKLHGLSSLQTFCTATNSSLCFFPKLEDLTMMGTNIEKLWPDQLMVSSSSSSSYMQNLTTLELERCDNLKYVFSFSVAQKFVNLQSIRVKDCEAMEDIIRVVDQPGEEETTHHNQMKRIDLFPKLEFLHLHGLSSLQKFSSAEKNCNKMKSLLSSAMARNLVQLESLHVNECVKMEEVIVTDEEYSSSSSSSSSLGGTNIEAIIPFQKLEYLHLWSLPNLKRFCKGDNCIECPLLSKMIVLGCPKLKEFMGDKRASSSSLSCTTTTTDNNVIGEEMDSMVSTPNTQSLFKHNNKVIFPMLKELKSDWSEGIKEIFEMSGNSDSMILFPNLSIVKCRSRDEAIVVVDGELINYTTPSSSLKELFIKDVDMVDDVCSRMGRFSDGIVNTSASLLNTIKVDEEIIPVERDDVNATLAKHFNLGLPHLFSHQM